MMARSSPPQRRASRLRPPLPAARLRTQASRHSKSWLSLGLTQRQRRSYWRKALLPLRDAEAHWYDAGASLVSEGVHRIPLPLPGVQLRAVNVYLIESDEGPVLIDAGWSVPAALETLRDAFAALDLELRD